LVKQKKEITGITIKRGNLRPEIGISENIYAETSFRKGEEKQLGQYRVKFVDYKPWTGIIFVKSLVSSLAFSL